MLGIIHISDIHLIDGVNTATERIPQVKSAVVSEAYDTDDLLLIVSGDVAFSGKQKQYSIATGLIHELENQLRAIPKVNFVGTAVLPGNHDCDFDNEGEVRPALLSTVAERIEGIDAAGDFVEQVLRVQEEFFRFEELISGKPRHKSQRLAWIHEFKAAFGTVVVRCLNTAWLSRKREIPGQLYFPLQAVLNVAESDANLVITALHHPYTWLQPENGRALRRIAETTSDIILTGHEHDGEAYSKTSASVSVNYVEGAALQASGTPSAFYMVKVDVKAETYQVRQFEWDKDMYRPGSLTASMFTRNQALLEHQFINNDSFKTELDDIGTPFSHQFKTQLSLSDLFVYPDLKVTTVKAKAGSETVIRSAEAFEYVASKHRICIAGAPTSGKTSLAKVLYSDLQLRKKLVPLLLTPGDIRGASPSQVHAAIERAFERQYPKRMLDRFNQLDADAKVLIVDDWHKVSLSSRAKTEVLDTLERLFARSILFTDDASLLQQVTEALTSGALPRLEYCEIKQFGFRLRGELVTKWEALGRELDTEELALTHKIAESEYLLDNLIGKGVVPAFPFFIFSALQADASTVRNANFGAYGHIYESLLTVRLARVNPKNLGQKFTYLSFLAYRLLETGHDTIRISDVRLLHDKYEKEYMVSLSMDQMLAECAAAQVLTISQDEVQFKYRYGYYFFAAQYLHDGISNVKDAERLREKLTTLADSAHNDENAHILVFYLYMSKDRVLMEHILANATKLFAEGGASDLSSDVQFANALYVTPPKLTAPSSDTEINREERRSHLDEIEEQENPNPPETPDTRKIDFAMQSMKIMGQVLRNFPGDLRADLKLRLTQESYQLGLRALRTFLRFLQQNIDDFRRDMVSYLRMLQPSFRQRPDDELQAAADKVFISLTEMVLFGMIKKISMSVGVEELKATYEVVRRNAGEDHVPTRIIDLAIKLDHFPKIPENDVKDLKSRLSGNPAVYTTLRMLVGEFLYLFPVDYKTRQKMIDLLDFQAGPATMSADKRVKKLRAVGE